MHLPLFAMPLLHLPVMLPFRVLPCHKEIVFCPHRLLQGSQSQSPLPLTGPECLEGTSLSDRIVASCNYVTFLIYPPPNRPATPGQYPSGQAGAGARWVTPRACCC